ncbi:RNA-processing protein [Candidatus Micrarchaeota archaeon]|nr:RNA-processing protein [Candidatus Micrarchaeota archaeon]
MQTVLIDFKRINCAKKTAKTLSTELKVKTEFQKDGQNFIASIAGEGGSEWIAEQILKAVNCGFDEKTALKLLSDEFFLDFVDLNASLWGKKKAIERYSARIIGSQGKVRKTLEELTGARISVSEESVAIIGDFDEIDAAKEAIHRILEGRTHETVYAFLERLKQKREAKRLGARL